MKMITEDYVSFEIAKLLKENGFDEECITAYFKEKLVDYTMFGFCLGDELVPAPTLQMAMKWLVREYKLYVNVVPSVEGHYWTDKWHSYAEDLSKRYPFGEFIGTFNSPEQAAEAAIKYCLENLI